MNVTLTENGDERRVRVTLSKRNLETLLSKLGREDSARTLTRLTDDDVYLTVIAEPDDVHYAGRTPGAVYPLDEPKRAT